MGEKNYEFQDQLNFKYGMVFFIFFLLLIITGIVVKRIFHHPEFMMLFHGPAAIFLVVAGLKFTAKQRRNFSHVDEL